MRHTIFVTHRTCLYFSADNESATVSSHSVHAMSDLDSELVHCSLPHLGHATLPFPSPFKQHLERCVRFCKTHSRDQRKDRPRHSVSSDRLHVVHAMRPDRRKQTGETSASVAGRGRRLRRDHDGDFGSFVGAGRRREYAL